MGILRVNNTPSFVILGQNSPSPGIIVPTRQKPLKGGLNQLNSTPDKTKTLPPVKKLPPTNFAQAVASAPLSIKGRGARALGFQSCDKVFLGSDSLFILVENNSNISRIYVQNISIFYPKPFFSS